MSDNSATKVNASGTTGSTCNVSGPYKSTRNTSVVIYYKRGDRFAADPVDGRSTTWVM